MSDRPKPTFASLNLGDEGLAKADRITRIFTEALNELEPHMTDPRCAALVRTRLEEACFFAKKAMSLDPANQKGAQ